MNGCAVHADRQLLQFINTTARAPYSKGNKSGSPAADKAQSQPIIATGKRALRALQTSGRTVPQSFSIRRALQAGRIRWREFK